VVLAEEKLGGASPNGFLRTPATDWSSLYRVGGIAALLAAVLTPIAITVFGISPPPYDDGAAEWFELLHDSPLLGLVSLDLLFVIVNVLMIPVMLGLYVALRRLSPAYMTLAIATFFVGLAAFLATNPSIEMLSLSDRYANATSEGERIALLGAGESLLAGFEGTAFHLNYILAQLAGIVIGTVILRGSMFGRTIGWLMIIGNAVGFGLYLPVVGLGMSAFAGVILWVWLVFLARRFFQLSVDPVGRATTRTKEGAR